MPWSGVQWGEWMARHGCGASPAPPLLLDGTPCGSRAGRWAPCGDGELWPRGSLASFFSSPQGLATGRGWSPAHSALDRVCSPLPVSLQSQLSTGLSFLFQCLLHVAAGGSQDPPPLSTLPQLSVPSGPGPIPAPEPQDLCLGPCAPPHPLRSVRSAPLRPERSPGAVLGGWHPLSKAEETMEGGM